jgi:hypothetical protein
LTRIPLEDDRRLADERRGSCPERGRRAHVPPRDRADDRERGERAGDERGEL